MGLIFNLIQMKILHTHHDDDHHDHHKGPKSGGGEVDNNMQESLLTNEMKQPQSHRQHDTTAEKSRNINVESAYLHVLGDMLMSCGVILAATIIYFRPDLWWFDPICTWFFAAMICFTSYPTLRNCLNVMMESAPETIDSSQLEQDIWEQNQADIIDVHDMHVWQLSMGKLSMSVHIKSRKPLKTLAAVTDLCRRKYNLFHTTIQVEGVDDPKENPHHFHCENDIHDLNA